MRNSNELGFYEERIIADTIKTLVNTEINPKQARALAKEIRDFTTDWYPGSDTKNSPSKADLAENRKSQDFLFPKLYAFSYVLVYLIDRENAFGRAEENADFLFSCKKLLEKLQQYAHSSLHQIKFGTLYLSFAVMCTAEDGITSLEDYLRDEETISFSTLDMKATVKDETVILMPISEVEDDSEYLHDLARSRRFLVPEDSAILSRIIGNLLKADKNGETVNKKDLEALNLIALNALLDGGIDPALRVAIDALYQFLYERF